MRRVRNRLYFLSDALVLCVATWLAYMIRFEGANWDAASNRTLLVFLAVGVVVKLALFYGIGMYSRLWRYAGIPDLEIVGRATLISGVLSGLLGGVLLPAVGAVENRVPLSVLVLDAGFTALFVGLSRFAARWRTRQARVAGLRPTIIVGAGAAGGLIVRELLENTHFGLIPVGLVDDDQLKQGFRLNNIPVLGTIAELAKVAEHRSATDVIIAIPSAPGKTVREIVRQASAKGLATRTVPGLSEILSGEKTVGAIRDIEISDLLRREPVSTDAESVKRLVTGRTVLVTGAGGSIGGELCRQLARLEPERLIALGRGENSIFELLYALRADFPKLNVVPVIADVRDERKIQRIFGEYRPYSVLHAAAHKHVPLMEANVSEAVLNNVFGTLNVVHCASLVGTEHFVLVSTDKAVRPTSVMGATKRIAELLVHEMAADHPRYVAVRFGNVLGSRGSVVPTFMRQIAAGGPVTITHPGMTRYFMTIPEAVQLVLQAAVLGEDGEVFVLDMGEPVRIVDLATDMIRLSGLEVGTDIAIKFLGTRPGEKLFEELFFGADVAMPTSHPKILRARDSALPVKGMASIQQVIDAARSERSGDVIRDLLRQVVPDYVGGAEAPVDDDL